MKKSTIALFIILLLLLAAIIYSFYLGVFTHITVWEEKQGGYKVAGMEYTGPYSKAGKYISATEKKLNAFNLSGKKSFGIYYDNPKVVLETKCRSFVGTILEKEDDSKIPALKAAGFRIDSIPVANAVVGTFPIKSSFSYMIAPMKVYPEMNKYMNLNGYTSDLSMEIYDVPAKTITFVMHFLKK